MGGALQHAISMHVQWQPGRKAHRPAKTALGPASPARAELNPNLRSITYDIGDLYSYIDQMPDLSALGGLAALPCAACIRHMQRLSAQPARRPESCAAPRTLLRSARAGSGTLPATLPTLSPPHPFALLQCLTRSCRRTCPMARSG